MRATMLTSARGASILDDLKMQIAVQPESGRLPEVLYNTEREDSSRFALGRHGAPAKKCEACTSSCLAGG
jgi:hypothetical protein